MSTRTASTALSLLAGLAAAAGCGGDGETVTVSNAPLTFRYVDEPAPSAPAGWRTTSNRPSGMTFAYPPSWRSSEAGVAEGPDGVTCAGDTRRRGKPEGVEEATTSYVRGFEATGAKVRDLRIERYPDRELGRFETPTSALAVGVFPRADVLWCKAAGPAGLAEHRRTFDRIIATLALPED